MGLESLKLEGEVEGTAYLPAYDAGETSRDEFRCNASLYANAMVAGVVAVSFAERILAGYYEFLGATSIWFH